jgi:hypothetical protein
MWFCKMTTVVFIEHPVWFQKETSVDHSSYVRIYRFGFNAITKCFLLDGTRLTPSDVLEGSLNGWYECRLIRSDDWNSKGRSLKYIKDSIIMESALGLTGIIILCAFAFGRH